MCYKLATITRHQRELASPLAVLVSPQLLNRLVGTSRFYHLKVPKLSQRLASSY